MVLFLLGVVILLIVIVVGVEIGMFDFLWVRYYDACVENHMKKMLKNLQAILSRKNHVGR